MFEKIINSISKITNYNTLIIPLLLIICGTESFENEFQLVKFVVLATITVIITLIFPKIIVFISNKKKKSSFNDIISNIISYFIGFIILFTLNIDLFMTLLFLTYSLTSIILLVLVKQDLKISINAFYLCGLFSALILCLGYFAWPISILYALSLWPNIFQKKYSTYEEINSGIISFITVPLIMYLLTPYNHVYDIIWIISSFIIYPIIYEIAEHYKINLDKFKSEVIFGLTLLTFVLSAPYSAFSLIFIFVTSLIMWILKDNI